MSFIRYGSPATLSVISLLYFAVNDAYNHQYTSNIAFESFNPMGSSFAASSPTDDKIPHVCSVVFTQLTGTSFSRGAPFFFL